MSEWTYQVKKKKSFSINNSDVRGWAAQCDTDTSSSERTEEESAGSAAVSNNHSETLFP